METGTICYASTKCVNRTLLLLLLLLLALSEAVATAKAAVIRRVRLVRD